jgi:NAD(P)-dependent dehydrogenase (short-subunit alcohol dehydrogenase family)
MKLKDKVVVVTGGTSGIGQACALAFGSAGATVVVSGRDRVKLAETSRELDGAGIRHLALQADVSVEEDVARMVEETVSSYGRIDILLNNAGISMRALFEDLKLDVIRQVMDINFYGTVYATKYALPYLIQTKGSVVGVSSIAGYRGLPGRTGYTASKAAMQGFLEALRTEMIPHGVHVLVACPGYTTSNIRKTSLVADGRQQGETPLEEGKLMSSEEVAEKILQATLHRKRDLIMTTQGKLTVFLNKWIPGVMDKVVIRYIQREGQIKS